MQLTANDKIKPMLSVQKRFLKAFKFKKTLIKSTGVANFDDDRYPSMALSNNTSPIKDSEACGSINFSHYHSSISFEIESDQVDR